uniref:Reverse transcriptase domain-containing protein n=1 Tax=Homalodisca liturata TaxID=320908 RepID=A0A1B6J5X4_9HEMI
MSGFEAKKETSAVLLDLSKAFDIVPHNVLIKKLQSYYSKGKELLLMETYLTDRYQFVKISEEKSDVLRVLSGVPQGSVLGPFLFVIFVNDLPAFIPDKCILYADDKTLLTSSANSETNCIVKNYMVERSKLWFCVNQLSVNSSKTEEIVFS